MKTRDHSFLVGLAGGSASGKSTFSGLLAQALAAADPPLTTGMISTDSYFLPDSSIPRFYSTARGAMLPDYNCPDSIDAGSLLSDLEARSQALSRPGVLLVEGLMVLHLPALRERFDLRLFIELDADQRALRRLVRNLGHNYDPINDSSAEGIASYFLESAKVGHEKYVEPSRRFADFILRGDGDFSRSAALVAEMICGLLRHG